MIGQFFTGRSSSRLLDDRPGHNWSIDQIELVFAGSAKRSEMDSTLTEPGADIQTRQRLIDIAAELFSQHSYEGTSLQMIADQLGFRKGAIYHHFRTREDLLRAVLEPMLEHLRYLVESAERLRGPHARAEHMLTGYASHLAANRKLASVLALDPGVGEVLSGNPDWVHLIGRQIALLAAVESGPSGRVKAVMVMAGIAAAVDPKVTDLHDDALCKLLVEGGRRTLGLRTPRRQHEQSD
jgi:AcrR family transcriptional regulator